MRRRKKKGHAGSTDTGKSNQLLVQYYVTYDGCATWPEWAGTALHPLELAPRMTECFRGPDV